MKGTAPLSEQNEHPLVFLYLPDKHIKVPGRSHLSLPETRLEDLLFIPLHT
jgi:hypothetical protein